MEKTVGEIGILNSDLFSDQFFFSVFLYDLSCIENISRNENGVTKILPQIEIGYL